MDNTLQTKFNINSSSYITKPAANPEPEKKVSSDAGSNKQNSKNRNILLASLGGLAVLGGVAVWVCSRKPKAVNPPINVDNRDWLEINRLKALIKEGYLSKQQEILTELFGENKPPKSIREWANSITATETKNVELKESMLQHKDENIKALRTKIAALQGDEQWVQLRKLRKNLIEIYNGKGSPDEIAVAAKKVPVINDLLIVKAYPEEAENFRKLHWMEPEAAIKLVNANYKNVDEYYEAFKAAQTADINLEIPIRDREFNHFKPLALTDVFPDEAGSVVTCNKEIKKMDDELNYMKSLFAQYRERHSELVNEVRASEDYKALKRELVNHAN